MNQTGSPVGYEKGAAGFWVKFELDKGVKYERGFRNGHAEWNANTSQLLLIFQIELPDPIRKITPVLVQSNQKVLIPS
ncbi:hypothetical protein [Xanthovirga aplysinae]|uniref:hypothetical protein n=1 Tax=Xanthovirga aplysinae TaxID=2529853 RepID=UPI0012BB6BE4|nr:hypothetical protein [Xanthovirga aplysinae]MTI30780.1 hypothetical protein [Xanthovirga aplysinae]